MKTPFAWSAASISGVMAFTLSLKGCDDAAVAAFVATLLILCGIAIYNVFGL